MPIRLLLVRHGQTAFNAQTRFMGQMDVPLDAVGRAQAQAVAKRLSIERPAAIYSSSLSRALETAREIQAAIPSPTDLRIDQRLIEGAFGVWEGKTYDELRQQDAKLLAKWENAVIETRPPGAESLQNLAARVQAAYKDIVAAHADETVIVVAHGGTLQVLINQALGLPLEDYRKLWLSNASISELLIDARSVILFRLNDTSHLVGIQQGEIRGSPGAGGQHM